MLYKTNIPTILAAVIYMIVIFFPGTLHAAEIEDRSLTISTSAPSASNVAYDFNFTVPSSTVIKSVEIKLCEDATGACNIPAGLDTSSATLNAQPTGLGASSGWSADNSAAGTLRITNSSNSTPPSGGQTISFGSITNPSSTNTTFFARISTYSDDSYSTLIDQGTVAASTAEQITLSGTVPPILQFCVGKTISGNCGTATGNSIDFGTFSPTATRSGTTQMRASTNAPGGYVITIKGTTLTSGTNTIPALSTQTPSNTGVSQFGLNLRNNATPNVGSDPTGSGIGTYNANYGTVDEYRFNSGDTVAQASQETNPNTFTVSYITNIESKQAAGLYSTTLTYICTGTF